MWEPQPLTPLWAFTACYRDSFTFYETINYSVTETEVVDIMNFINERVVVLEESLQ
jgi:hypothetical protein